MQNTNELINNLRRKQLELPMSIESPAYNSTYSFLVLRHKPVIVKLCENLTTRSQ